MDMENGELTSLDKLILSLSVENIHSDIELAKRLQHQRHGLQQDMDTNRQHVQAIVQSMKYYNI